MSVPRPTEMTIRSLLLRELDKRGVKVTPEVSFSTPVGRMMPDALLKNGGDYVIETKLGAEAKLFDALIRLYDYSKYTEARGAFAILFPEQLRRPMPLEMLEKVAADPALSYLVTAIFKDLRPTQRFAGNIFQVADWISAHVLKAPVVEADTSLAIRVLSDAVEYITACTRQLKGKELEDIFGGKTVFENILQYEEGRYPLEEMRRAATYLLINQILFYHVLSRTDQRYPSIDETKIGRPGDLARYFNEVLKVDYTSTFGFDVASRLPENATEVVRKVVKVVNALAPEKIRHDVLGKVFHELIPFEVRKAVAAFYTNNEAAEILAQLAIDDPNAKVLDLAVGSGTLLVAPYRRKRELLFKEKGYFSLEDHKRFLEEDLTGIDIMPFAAHLAVVHLSLQALLYESEKVRIAVWDSTELKPGQVIPAISRELRAAYRKPTLDIFMKGQPSPEEPYMKKGAVTVEGVGGEEIPLEQADVVIMNPPFTRQQRIPSEYKQVLADRFSDQPQYVHGQMGYHGYFILLANRFLKDGGRLAIVLPASVLNADGFSKIRELLTHRYHIEHIVTTWQRAAFSEGAQFREILLIAKKVEHGVPDEKICAITELKRLPHNLEEARDFAIKIKDVTKIKEHGIVYDDEAMQASLFMMGELKRSVDNLFKLIAFRDKRLIDVWQSIVYNAGDKFIELGEYLDRYGSGPKEGAALGQVLKGGGIGALYIHKDPSKALKKTDVWILKKVDKTQALVEHKILHNTAKIPLNVLRSAMRRFSGINTLDVTKKLDYIVTDKFPGAEEFLFLGFNREINTNFLRDWKKYVNTLLGNLGIACHVDVSASGTSALAYYSSMPMIVPRNIWSMNIVDHAARILTLWLNSTLTLLQILLVRKETRGAYIRLDASVIRKFMVPNLDKMSKKELEILLQTFDKMRSIKFTSILEQLRSRNPQRVQIDRTIFHILGFPDKKIDELLTYLYPALTNEIETLKSLMEG